MNADQYKAAAEIVNSFPGADASPETFETWAAERAQANRDNCSTRPACPKHGGFLCPCA